MAVTTIYGKLTAVSEPEQRKTKLKQILELTALGKGAQNVYRIVVYGSAADMVMSKMKGKLVDTECYVNGRKFMRDPNNPKYGLELILISIEQR